MTASARLRPWLWGLLVALVFCAPYFLMPVLRSLARAHSPAEAAAWVNDGSFALVAMYGTENVEEEIAYAAEVQEASEHLIPYDPYIRENKSVRMTVLGHLSFRAMSLVHIVTGNIQLTWLIVRILCCLFWFVLVYHMTFRMTRSESLSVFCGAFVTCFSYLLTLLFLDKWIYDFSWPLDPVHYAAQSLWALATFGRTESVYRLTRPGVAYSLLFLASLFNVRAAESKKVRDWVLGGLPGGLLAYVSPDCWSGYLAGSFLFAVFHAYKHGLRSARGPIVATLSALAVSLPFVLLVFPAPAHILERTGAHAGRYFSLMSIPYALGAWFAFARSKNSMTLFCTAMVAGLFFILNSQLITGYSHQWNHWEYFVNIFFFLLAISLLPKKWIERPRLWRGLTALVLCVTLAQGAGFAARKYTVSGLNAEYEAALDWLNAHTEEESVVAALNSEVIYLIPAMTRNKVIYAATFAPMSDISPTENARRVALTLRWLGADKDKFIREVIFRRPDQQMDVRKFSERGEIEKANFLNYHFLYLKDVDVARMIKEGYRNFDTNDVRVDYVWIGDYEREYVSPDFPKDAVLNLEEVYRNPSVTLYRVRKPST